MRVVSVISCTTLNPPHCGCVLCQLFKFQFTFMSELWVKNVITGWIYALSETKLRPETCFVKSRWLLTFDRHILISESLSSDGPLLLLWRNSLNAFLRYDILENGKDEQAKNLMPLAMAVTNVEALRVGILCNV